MHTRIKYVASGAEGERLTSRQIFTINGEDMLVVLYPKTFKFEIIGSENRVVVEGGNTKNLAVLKKQAKRALEKAGYEFGSETRSKRKPEHLRPQV